MEQNADFILDVSSKVGLFSSLFQDGEKFLFLFFCSPYKDSHIFSKFPAKMQLYLWNELENLSEVLRKITDIFKDSFKQ